MLIEILMPDFQGRLDLVNKIIQAQPAVYAHNIETVERLTPRVRDRRAIGYQQSLDVLDYIKKQNKTNYTKSSIMLGLGESEAEVLQTMRDLRSIDVDFLLFGQYLRPSLHQLKVVEYIHPEFQFAGPFQILYLNVQFLSLLFYRIKSFRLRLFTACN